MNRTRGAILLLVQICFLGSITCSDKAIPSADEVSNALCWMKEEFSAVGEDCKPCQSLDYKLYTEACSETGYREKVKCASGAETYKSCAKPNWIKERVFWAFECVMLITGLCACGMVFIRRKKIERDMMQRVQRQISAAV